MTCGACEPSAFRTEPGVLTLGYVVASCPAKAARDTRQLHYLGAELVLSDTPKGQVRYRAAFAMLGKWLRPGDTLIVADLSCFGTKPERIEANSALLEDEGVTIQIMKREDFEQES